MNIDVESEAMLEEKFINQLSKMGYEFIKIKNEEELNANFKIQLEKLNKKELNGTPISDEEFDRILTYLDSGSIFDRADKLRDEYTIKRDNAMSVSIKFLNQKDWCKNIFQVSNQITMVGSHKNRYDVTILINGLPLIQIELKRRSMDIKQAFNQVKRYMKTSYDRLFKYIQIFVISNGNETKYFANGRPSKINFGYTFFWKDKENNNIHNLHKFTEAFLEKCNIAKMISKFMVLNESTKELMVLRAYQKYAVDAVLNQALEVKKNGYIWHTTGSGKTLTSFKVSQLLAEEESIYKVIFVVDRRDLNDQTNKEFNKFCPKCVGTSAHTGALVKNLLSDKNKLITTTIQKLSIAVNRKHTRKKLEKIKDKNIILIFDECHRSQFGKMHNDITTFFENTLSYGFTGTPIFEANAMGTKTTKSIFKERLHTYMIKDAIADQNVLGFSIDYYSTMKTKEGIIDEEVAAIKKTEVLAHPDRLNMIVDHILDSYDYKTKDREFNAIFAVSQKSKENPTGYIHDYYKILKQKNKERGTNLKIATIFTYAPNENFDEQEKHSQEHLDDYIKEYNETFGTNFDSDTMGEYHRDVCKRMKHREIDLLLVVNMFLTGFDSKLLNTLYVDKNLEYHTLLQAFSRTNRIYNARKSQGNIVCYRPIKESVDRAIALFSNNAPIEDILLPPYKDLVKRFNEELKVLRDLVKTAQEVYELQSENDKKDFVLAFKKLIKTKNKLDVFSEFTFDDLEMTEQEYEDYTGAYLNIKDTIPPEEGPGAVSILKDIDFELELLTNDKINVDYILGLIDDMKVGSDFDKGKEKIIKLMEQSVHLRSKIKLIEKFIDVELQDIKEKGLDVPEEFDRFVRDERRDAICDLIEEEELIEEVTREILSEYEFTEKLDDTLIKKAFKDKELKYKDKKNKLKKVKQEILEIFDIFDF
ncbi:type I restriction endonuclease subunit R [Methanobrevibacter thaueri]|uniref:type I site-specific deoxyribonuclease n=1 Tax=Methanobrevibacter thaueri TaxID=190975 RepID=A0A315XNF5_9EURY|nr:type I restriction endonuclease subunit R [Methanobrevibacter thaueri]PWB87855.1 type-1 restriction enzyme R protein [Methanobrevibacter thaueri]